jgi:ABC-type multidrug transport system ATPase subunit
VHISWRDLALKVKLKSGAERTLLHGVSGQVPPGQVLALMGASGAGKTTLLNCLAQRTTGWTGSVTLNGASIDGAVFRRIAGYVTQDVPTLEFLTVRETLLYAARLRLPGAMPAAAKVGRVERVIDLLDLRGCAHTRVGRPAEAGGVISGGERRRLALGCELLFDPHLIICDEITSGLDAASAMRIGLILRRLAREEGRTVVLTLHQPRAALLDVFDQLMLLAGGRVVYYGPSQHRPLAAYFARAGFPLPRYENPADGVIDLINADHDGLAGVERSSGGGDDEDDDEGAAGDDDGGTALALAPLDGSDARAPSPPLVASAAPADAVTVAVVPAVVASPPPAPACDDDGHPHKPGAARQPLSTLSRRHAAAAALAAHYAASPLAAWARQDPPAFPPPAVPAYGAAGRKYPTSWFTQARVVCERAFVYKWRNPDAVLSQLVGSVVMSIIVGSVFWRLPLTAAGVRDRMSAIAFILLTQSFIAFDQCILLPTERSVMLRDSQSGCYSTGAFYVGRTFAELPPRLLFSVLTAVITNYMFGLKSEPSAVGTWILVLVLVTEVGAALLTLVGAVSSNMAMANGIATIVISFSSLFNSFFIAPSNIHVV